MPSSPNGMDWSQKVPKHVCKWQDRGQQWGIGSFSFFTRVWLLNMSKDIKHECKSECLSEQGFQHFSFRTITNAH